MASNPKMNTRTWQSLCLALTASMAPAVVMMLIMAIGVSVVQDLRARSVARERDQSGWEDLAIDGDGRPLIRVRSQGPEHWLDSQRRPVDKPSSLILPHADLTRENPRVRIAMEGRAEGVTAIPLTYPGTLEIDWFLVLVDRSTGRACFEGYHRLSAKRVGWIGVEGFAEAPLAPDAHFSVDAALFRTWPTRIMLTAEQVDWKTRYFDAPNTTPGQSPLSKHDVVLHAGDRLFLVDLAKQTTEELLPGATVFSVDSTVRPRHFLSTDSSIGSEDVFKLDAYIAARTADRVILLSPRTKVREEYSLTDDLKARDFRISLPTNGSAVFQSRETISPEQLAADRRYTMDVQSVASDGGELRSEQITLQAVRTLNLSRRTQLSVLALAIPAPLLSPLLSTLQIGEEDALSFTAAFPKALALVWPTLLVVVIVALTLAWWTDRRQRVYGLGSSVSWFAFVFLLGVPGFVAYLVHRRWPIRNPVPSPKRMGIEVFG